LILYKYVSFKTAKDILESSSIGFTCVEDFNDPFESTNFGFSDDGDVSPRLGTRACKNNFSRKYSVLSLTRNPLNSLMWSHYGDSHRGVVIGIDVKEAQLDSENTFSIPIQFGEVTYIKTKPQGDNSVPTIAHLDLIGRSTLSYSSHYNNFLKRAFLYKSLEWGYEEEVRVIKNITDFNFSYHGSDEGEFNASSGEVWYKKRIEHLGQPLYCLSIPKSSIKEIYLGQKVNHNASRIDNGITEAQFNETLSAWKNKNIKVFGCDIDFSNWNMIANFLNES